MFKTNRLAVGIHSSLNPHPWRQLTPGNENLQGTGTFLGHWLRWDTFPEKRWSEIFRTQRQLWSWARNEGNIPNLVGDGLGMPNISEFV
jgi:hypothetical protein